MPYDYSSKLWPNTEEYFFRDRELAPIKQQGPHCVATSLAIVTSAEPERFQGAINTQDPVSWSEALSPWGMKLAYCPTDVRKLVFYVKDLIQLNDLFVLGYYTPSDSAEILADPDENGWVCSSHLLVLHRNKILDPKLGTAQDALGHNCNNYHTKRVFRVVPLEHRRGL